jgi:hypothetical protein
VKPPRGQAHRAIRYSSFWTGPGKGTGRLLSPHSVGRGRSGPAAATPTAARSCPHSLHHRADLVRQPCRPSAQRRAPAPQAHVRERSRFRASGVGRGLGSAGLRVGRPGPGRSPCSAPAPPSHASPLSNGKVHHPAPQGTYGEAGGLQERLSLPGRTIASSAALTCNCRSRPAPAGRCPWAPFPWRLHAVPAGVRRCPSGGRAVQWPVCPPGRSVIVTAVGALGWWRAAGGGYRSIPPACPVSQYCYRVWHRQCAGLTGGAVDSW